MVYTAEYTGTGAGNLYTDNNAYQGRARTSCPPTKETNRRGFATGAAAGLVNEPTHPH